ncbi:tRNA uridine-5-carboxymethylaminomethyl(34) synthesis GTPase MnmE [Sphingobium sufflavum]|uniref:tRNA uridine-5-carboxymethylaminomethyl(34) synthesis GTPase MnmE n=1 Tax=Sphingobium sufflavum TaxID=1129547 RepID=UPI001F44414E|nr:tRNA uridine-5-carboxymethylaminomethyl(34) synthesis GTPase MnmE [Sphingobium sufflavum]MCE7795077.1 tRNA uridine-5-carboxymethylaminomethyl(34) synthesis GTPase MnmE [Sphingobium sufflavum]
MSSADRRDTIYALSSGSPPAAIAIIRLSGPDAEGAAAALCGTLPQERRAGLRTLRDPLTGEALDEALVLRFAAVRSVTGEPLVELHCHGGRAVVTAVQDALGRLPGLRAAEAGEFTRQALENGRMDLNAVEGLSDLLHAETEAQRRAAMAMYGGAFSARVEDFQRRTLSAAALVEAALDFADEDDVDGDALAQAKAGITTLLGEMQAELAAPPVERLREGIRLVIAGPVNSGKSTLLNRLAGWEAAIVTDIEGTTRDRIEVPVAIGGTAYLLTDTAGFREAGDAVERIGIERAREAVAAADLLLWLGAAEDSPRPDAIRVLSRIDRPDVSRDSIHDVALSVHSGEGMADLIALVGARATALLPQDRSYLLSARQRSELGTAVAALESALAVRDPLLVAEHLRDALSAFDRLTGRASTEHMLDSLFGGFCIGK